MTRLRISRAVQRLLSGKIEDRLSGTTPMTGPYAKMIEAGADGSRYADVYIEASDDDCYELLQEMNWALDGEREINIGERASATALRNQAAAAIAPGPKQYQQLISAY